MHVTQNKWAMKLCDTWYDIYLNKGRENRSKNVLLASVWWSLLSAMKLKVLMDTITSFNIFYSPHVYIVEKLFSFINTDQINFRIPHAPLEFPMISPH